ncbi:MAG: MTH1187 family thiamine-binding protein [Methanobacteriota archaeon]
MAIAEFSITPIGVGVGVGAYVARAVDLVDRSGLPYRVNPMGTVVEGPLDDVVALIVRCHKAIASDCERVSTVIKIDDRKGASGQIDAKVRAVERRLGRTISV